MDGPKAHYHREEIQSAVERLTAARTFVEENLGRRVFGDSDPMPVLDSAIRSLNDADDLLDVERQIQRRILAPVESELVDFSSQLRRSNSWAWAVGLLGVLCTIVLGTWSTMALRASVDQLPRVKAGQLSPLAQFSGELAPEVDLAEGVKRLEAILGHYNEENPTLWWTESVRKTEVDQPIAEDGIYIMEDIGSFSTPFMVGELIAFDSVSLRRSWIYEDEESVGEEPKWGQQRHFADRYLLRRSGTGGWFVQRMAVGHSDPSAVAGLYSQGAVVWKEDGVEFVMTALEATLGPDNHLVDIPVLLRTRFRRIGDELIVETSYRYYEFLENAEGVPLPLPDVSRALSDEITFTTRMVRGLGSPPDL